MPKYYIYLDISEVKIIQTIGHQDITKSRNICIVFAGIVRNGPVCSVDIFFYKYFDALKYD